MGANEIPQPEKVLVTKPDNHVGAPKSTRKELTQEVGL